MTQVAMQKKLYPLLPGEVGVVNNNYPYNDIRRFGSTNLGAASETTPIVNAITSLPVEGGVIDLGLGKIRFTGDGSDISAAINSKRSVILRGRNGFNWRGNNSPPIPAATTVYWKDLTGYLYKKAGSINETFRFENVAFDGSNGGGTANGTTTCPGLVASNGYFVYFFSAFNCVFTDCKYAHSSGIGGVTGRAVFDLAASVFPSFDHCFFGACENGRWIFTDVGSTTFYANKCYFTGAREIAYHRGTTGVTYNDCVGESSVVGIINFMSSIRYTGKCHFENLGQTTGVAAWTTGLAPRAHGVAALAGTLAGNVSNAFNQLYGASDFGGAVFNSLKPGGPYTAWMEMLGIGAAGVADGGSLALRGGAKRTATESLFTATMLFGAVERGTRFIIQAEEGSSAEESLFGGALGATDARKVNVGFARIQRNDLTATDLVRIARGNFIYELQELPTAFSGKPTATQYPRGDQFLRGDLIRFSSVAQPSSSLGTFMLECTGSGTAAPTWALVAQVEAPSLDRGDASVVLVSLADQVIQMFNTPLTAPRTETLPSPANSFARQIFHTVRTANSTGASGLTVQTSAAVALKVMAVGTWARFIFSGASNEWIEFMAGAL